MQLLHHEDNVYSVACVLLSMYMLLLAPAHDMGELPVTLCCSLPKIALRQDKFETSIVPAMRPFRIS